MQSYYTNHNLPFTKKDIVLKLFSRWVEINNVNRSSQHFAVSLNRITIGRLQTTKTDEHFEKLLRLKTIINHRGNNTGKDTDIDC